MKTRQPGDLIKEERSPRIEGVDEIIVMPQKN
jgi:hypothetical protein